MYYLFSIFTILCNIIMANIFFPRFFYFLILTKYLTNASNQHNSDTIFTCCKFQSILDPVTGQCGHSSYEFEYDIFQPEWTIPQVLTENRAKFTPKRLEERAPWCKCTAIKIIPLQFRRASRVSNYTAEWVNDDDDAIKNPICVTVNGDLSVQGGIITSEQYCINKLHEARNQLDPSSDKLFLEFVLCHESCMKPLTEQVGDIAQLFSWTSSDTTTMDWSRTAFCEDLEQELTHVQKMPSNYTQQEGIMPLCRKWIPFYYQNEHFYLIASSQNKTIAIQDNSYPWVELPSNTFCKVRSSLEDEDGEIDGKLVKFCLSEIKKLFYPKQEIYAILAGVSGAFLLLNLTIYISLRQSLSISGWTEFFYSLSLYGFFVFSIVGLLLVPEGAQVGNLCYAIGVLVHYFELANGATLVALSLDIFWTFCKFDTDGYTDDPKVSKMRLFLYISFSLFFPLSIVSYGIVQNQRFAANHFGGTPQYGLFHCTSPAWPLSSYILFAMQGTNLILALISAYVILNKKNRSPRVFKFDQDDDYVLDPDRIDIFSKLLLFVFVFWLVNFMEFFYQGEIFPIKWHLVGFHLANYSQGIFAFLILVCNRRTMRGLVNGEWNLKSLFRHACCTCGSKAGGDNADQIPEDAVPLSPLMRGMRGSMRRATVRGNASY